MGMKAINRSIIAGAALALMLVFLFPPYMCVDRASNGRVHAALGHHSAWAPPAPEYAFRVLYPDTPQRPDPARLADFAPRINAVRLTMDVAAIALALVLVLSALRALKRCRARSPEPAR